MSRPPIDPNVGRFDSRWHWVVTVPILAAHLAGHLWALAVAMVLCVTVGGWFLWRMGRVRT